MKCNQCGFEFKDTAPYCPRCGAPQISDRQKGDARTADTEPAPVANPSMVTPTMPVQFSPDSGHAMNMPQPPAPVPVYVPNVGAPVPVPVPANAAKTASTALTCSILGLLTCGGLFHIISLVLSIVGFSMGSRATKESSATGQEGISTASTARNLGVVGMILAGLATFGTLLFFIIGLSANANFIEDLFDVFEDLFNELF